MDFLESIKHLAIKVPGQIDYVVNEAQTRSAFVEPFLRCLGYDPSNPQEVRPEFGANYDVPGVIKDKKVDYGIIANNTPIILIEVKHHKQNLSSGYAQLAAYFAASDATVGILTNGLTYKFYTDLEKLHLMDKRPFLTIEMLHQDEGSIPELQYLTKGLFETEKIKHRAKNLIYKNGIKQIFKEQFESPDDDFVKYFFKELCPEKQFKGQIKEDFCQYVKDSFTAFITDTVKKELDKIAKETQPVPDIDEPTETSECDIETTPEELEGFAVIKAILHEVMDVGRLYMRDKMSYCGILLDNKNTKPIVRLRFNDPNNLKLSLFDKPGSTAGEREDIIRLSNINDIYQYSNRIKATFNGYEL